MNRRRIVALVLGAGVLVMGVAYTAGHVAAPLGADPQPTATTAATPTAGSATAAPTPNMAGLTRPTRPAWFGTVTTTPPAYSATQVPFTPVP